MAVNGLFNVQTSIEDGAPEVEIKIDRMRAGMYNIDINTVISQIQDQLEGKNAGAARTRRRNAGYYDKSSGKRIERN